MNYIWLEISKIMVNSKERLPIKKDDVAVYVVNIPKVIEILKQNYKIEKINEK